VAVEHLEYVEPVEHIDEAAYHAAPRDRLASALPLAGFALAHAALSIETTRTLCPLAAIAQGGQLRRMVRYPAKKVEDSVRTAVKHLTRELGDAEQAALVYAGYVTHGKRKGTHALIVEVIGPGGMDLGRLVQPYRRWRFRVPALGYLRGFSIRGRLIVDHLIEDGEIDDRGAEARIYTGVWDHPAGARLFGRARTSRPLT